MNSIRSHINNNINNYTLIGICLACIEYFSKGPIQINLLTSKLLVLVFSLILLFSTYSITFDYKEGSFFTNTFKVSLFLLKSIITLFIFYKYKWMIMIISAYLSMIIHTEICRKIPIFKFKKLHESVIVRIFLFLLIFLVSFLILKFIGLSPEITDDIPKEITTYVTIFITSSLLLKDIKREK